MEKPRSEHRGARRRTQEEQVMFRQQGQRKAADSSLGEEGEQGRVEDDENEREGRAGPRLCLWATVVYPRCIYKKSREYSGAIIQEQATLGRGTEGVVAMTPGSNEANGQKVRSLQSDWHEEERAG